MRTEVPATYTVTCDVCGSDDVSASLWGMVSVGVFPSAPVPVDVCPACVSSATVANVLDASRRLRAALAEVAGPAPLDDDPTRIAPPAVTP